MAVGTRGLVHRDENSLYYKRARLRIDFVTPPTIVRA